MEIQQPSAAQGYMNFAVGTGVQAVAASDPFAFDPAWYLANNPDLQAAGYTVDNVFNHYLQFGTKEGRAGSQAEAAYLQVNPDVAQAIKNGQFKSGLDHYLAFGKKEGRAYMAGTAGEELARALDVLETSKKRAQDDLQKYLDNAGLERQDYLTNWQEQTKRAQEQIGGQAASSGLYFSGGRIKTQQEAQTEAERQKTAYERGYQYSTTGAKTAAERQLEDIRKQAEYGQKDYLTLQQEAQLAQQRYLEDLERQKKAYEQQLAKEREESIKNTYTSDWYNKMYGY